MPDDIINNDAWLELAEKKPGVKTLAKVPQTITDAEIAYFKYPLNANVGPIAANEFIASKIGEKLDIPVAKVRFKNFSGLDGILSYKTPGEANMWRQYPYKADIEETLDDLSLLGKLIAFDVFILNTDRNQDNLMYSRIGKRKFDLYLIDHAYSLYGPNQQPNDFNNFSFSGIVQIAELRLMFKKGFDFFKEHLDDITELDDIFLIDLVGQVPPQFLADGQKHSVKELLVQRKKMIYNKFEEFCKNPAW